MPRTKKDVFSVTKAVKANARARLGTPPPSTPIPDRKTKAEHSPEKHKRKLHEIMDRAQNEHP